MSKKKKRKRRIADELIAAFVEFAEALERRAKTPCRKPRYVKRVRK
jgi:hypothetical protein